jgi:hypothetical protein
MFFFEKRKDAREFARKQDHYKLVDNGTYSPEGRRWAVKVLQD